MTLKALLPLLGSVPQYQGLLASLGSDGSRQRAQTLSNGLSFLVASLWNDLRLPTMLLVPRPEDARRFHEQLVTWCGQEAPILHFPEADALPFERLVSDVTTVHQRLSALSTLLHAPDTPGLTPLVVSSVMAAAQGTLGRGTMSALSHTLEKGQTINPESLFSRWHRMGYQFERAVETPGSASRRGGIVDIFPVGASLPSRIEFWGDQIESIRLFEPATQRSIQMVETVTIVPAQEILPSSVNPSTLEGLLSHLDMSNCTTSARERIEEELSLLANGQEIEELNFYAGFFSQGLLLDYLPKNALIILYNPSEVTEATREADERESQLRKVKEERGELPRNFPSSHAPRREIERRLEGAWKRLEVLPWGAEGIGDSPTMAIPFGAAPSFWGRLDLMGREASRMAEEGQRVIALTYHAQRLTEVLEEQEVTASLFQTLEEPPPPGSVSVLQGSLDEGFTLTVDGGGITVLSDAEIFGTAKQRRQTRRRSVRREAFLSELTPGDFVVHIEHGIGRFLGSAHLDLEGSEREYLILEYAHGDKLYVPTDHLDRVAPYIAPMEQPPSVTRLGTQEWSRVKERVKRSTREMAAELISLYASREVIQGFPFAPDAPWQRELEDSFPYEETPDQLETIDEVKADMERPKPMDRLVCGDVGYGKTEVALRAAFKAVMDGAQVAVLVPTTVLAQQHYATFSQRLSPFPITVEVLSRFRTDREQRELIEDLTNGKIDICIGTHRLLQRDVSFKNLGLVVVDEEQRFGVEHKERFKQMRKEVDVLTLSATPIPRTLHMSLAGVRDMSTMETPPEERLPIKTYVSEFSDELIREAILRELDRQGQVFFLHNRVRTIDFMAGWLRELAPEATFGVAHGQMPEGQLERVIAEFAQGRIDVLVCTTIIESGVDMPNVNTLIVNRADMFGLAQLYQLRGRVGRGSHRAYAYFLVPKGKRLTEAAEKRLKTILAASELGAGFRIAMRDLEIRGAGNLVGREQSGHIQAVGFDLYTRLLSEAVEEIRARREERETEGEEAGIEPGLLFSLPDIKIDLGVPAHLPEGYIEDVSTRLGLYHRLIGLRDTEQIEPLAEEMRDRFGPLPWQAYNLLYVARLKLLARSAGVVSVTRENSYVVFRLKDAVGGARVALQKALGHGVTIGNTLLRMDLAHHKDGWQEPLAQALERLATFREQVLQAAR